MIYDRDNIHEYVSERRQSEPLGCHRIADKHDSLHAPQIDQANGTGQPSIFNVLKHIRYMGHTANTDEDTLKAYSSLLRDIAEKEGRPAGAPLEYDLACYKHQVPGGVWQRL